LQPKNITGVALKSKLAKTILFLPMQQRVEFDSEESLLEIALKNDIGIAHSCGGMGTCGTCRVEIQSDLSELTGRNSIEEEMAMDRGFLPYERLACQLTPQKDIIAKVWFVLEELDEDEL
jgi:2Fe-2S ferredoxin